MTKQALIARCEQEGREARRATKGRRDCPYRDQETVAREAWLRGYSSEKALQFGQAYGITGGE